MAEIDFDRHGFLKPYQKITMELDEFLNIFVDTYDQHSTRHKIILSYQQYISDFKAFITPHFSQLINGSFVSNKENLKDIDDDQHILQVADLLMQIQDVNRMIKIHQDDEDDFMLAQYQYRKNKLTKALAEILDSFDVNLKDWAA